MNRAQRRLKLLQRIRAHCAKNWDNIEG